MCFHSFQCFCYLRDIFSASQVPESEDDMIKEGSAFLLAESSSVLSEVDLLVEELSFSTLAPVQLPEITELRTPSPEHPASRGSTPEQIREYMDLDHDSDSQDMSFYDDTSKNILSNAGVKTEECLTSCCHPQTNGHFEQCTFDDMSSVIFRDQMEEIQRACQTLGILPGRF